LREIGDAEDFRKSLLDLGSVSVGFERKKEPAVCSLYFVNAKVFENRVDVGTEPVLKKIAVALLEAEFVVVNDDPRPDYKPRITQITRMWSVVIRVICG
jgi:hypothetical protein